MCVAEPAQRRILKKVTVMTPMELGHVKRSLELREEVNAVANVSLSYHSGRNDYRRDVVQMFFEVIITETTVFFFLRMCCFRINLNRDGDKSLVE